MANEPTHRQLLDEIEELKEERRVDQHARISSLEIWRGSVDAEMTAMKESVGQIKDWFKESDKKNDDRLRHLEKTIYKAGGALALGVFILSILPHILKVLS